MHGANDDKIGFMIFERHACGVLVNLYARFRPSGIWMIQSVPEKVSQ